MRPLPIRLSPVGSAGCFGVPQRLGGFQTTLGGRSSHGSAGGELPSRPGHSRRPSGGASDEPGQIRISGSAPVGATVTVARRLRARSW